MADALGRHDAIVRSAVEDHDGYVFSAGGDGFAVAFRRAADALAAAVDIQSVLEAEPWPQGAVIRVRMGLHTGEVIERDGDYFGPSVNRAARLMAVAHGGQVVCSQATAALAGPTVGLIGLGEHRLRDLGAAEVVFQVGSGSFPQLRSLDAVPTNLPTVRTELIGRSADIEAVSSLVEREHLVTLTGVGGVGKTRLALGVAGALTARFSDGCWLVDLTPLADGSEVAKTAAAAIGAPAAVTDDLARYLADRELLLVLDNCEHVLTSAADLVDALFDAARDVRVLATSREPLGLEGERVHRVESLALPSVEALLSEAEESPAVQLFAERAIAVDQRFVLGPENVGAVMEICRHLDGIPLAIELAAARSAAMPPAEIAGRLGERFRLLAGGSRRTQERHRTLLATVTWSYELLSEEEKFVFRRLAVFPASFDLGAAEAVASSENVDVLETVVRLVARSVLQFDPDEGRYRLLETLREYAADRLLDAGETDLARERHVRYFLELAESVAPHLRDARSPRALTLLSAELDNLRSVADWCADGGRWRELASLVGQLWVFLYQTAPIDGATWLTLLIDHGDELDPQDLVDVLGEMAYLTTLILGDHSQGLELAECSVTTAERHRATESQWAWNASMQAAVFTSTLLQTDGRGVLERSLAAAAARHDEYAATVARISHAFWLDGLGQVSEALGVLDDTLHRAEASGNPVSVRTAMLAVAYMHLFAGAEPDFDASLAILSRYPEESGSDDVLAFYVQIDWGATLVGLRQPGAVTHLAHAARLADRQNGPHTQDLALRLLAVAAAHGGHDAEAAILAAYCDAHLREHRLTSAGYDWVNATLARGLLGIADRDEHEMAGAQTSRRQIMDLVDHVEVAPASGGEHHNSPGARRTE
jgi:predicted ATPase